MATAGSTFAAAAAAGAQAQKMNGAAGPPTQSPQRRRVSPELEQKIIKALKAGDSGASIQKWAHVASSTIFQIRVRSGLPSPLAGKLKPARVPTSSGNITARRNRMDAHFAAGRTPVEAAKLEGITATAAYAHRVRWRKTGKPGKVRGRPRGQRDSGSPRALEPPSGGGLSLAAQKAFDLAYAGAYERVRAGGTFTTAELDFLRGYELMMRR
jgi:hypothetical protein